MVRSGDLARAATAAVLLLLLGGLFGGCVETTEQKNARVELQDDRLLASRSPVRVTRADPDVAVLAVKLLRAHARTAVAVTVLNRSPRAASDLPLNVGIETRAGAVYLNRAAELPYFQTHIGGLAGRAQATWTFIAPRSSPAGRPFARVGASVVRAGGGSGVPAISASLVSVRVRGRDSATAVARVTNHSGVAQSGLELYAHALAGERLVAAGAAPLESVGSGASKTVQISLVGSPGAHALQLDIPPTNLR